MSAVSELSPRVGNRFAGCGILDLLFGTIAYGASQIFAFGATGPVDDTVIETEIRPAAAAVTSGAARLNKPAVDITTGNPLWTIPLKSLSGTHDRPLFSPSRRPPLPVVVAAPPAPPPPPAKPAAPDHPLLTLVGTAVGDAMSIGIFTDEATKNVVRMQIGEDHGGWTLRAIRRREAVFENDQREVTLALPARSAMEQMSASVPPPPAIATQSADARVGGNGQSTSTRPSPSPQAGGKPSNTPPSKWLDGDGQSISAPPMQTAGVASPPTWRDGDGQLISAPPMQKAGAASPPTWLDGDGRLISAPPLPRMTEHGKPPGPPVWLDPIIRGTILTP